MFYAIESLRKINENCNTKQNPIVDELIIITIELLSEKTVAFLCIDTYPIFFKSKIKTK